MRSSAYLLLLTLALLVSGSLAVCPHTTGTHTLWSTLGHGAGANVVIGAGQRVLVNQNTAVLGTVTVRNGGELILGTSANLNTPMTFDALWIKVETGGKVKHHKKAQGLHVCACECECACGSRGPIYLAFAPAFFLACCPLEGRGHTHTRTTTTTTTTTTQPEPYTEAHTHTHTRLQSLCCS